MAGAAAGRAVLGPGRGRRKRARRRLLVTTETEEKAMAAPAMIGLRSPATASGMAAVLYPKAQPRFWRMVRNVRRERRMAVATPSSSAESRVMSELSMATSVPVPMAMPRSAWTRAGASLTPSPTMATTRPCS